MIRGFLKYLISDILLSIYLDFGVFTAEVKKMSAITLKGRKAKALYDFHGENEDELSFKVRTCIFSYPY